jgi:tRNA A-37 threonylcarbamoyl transferase component Bud32
VHCPSCSAQNEPAAENCFTCGKTFGPSKGALIGQRYEVVQLLGRGGMGTIYKARDQVLDETVALKTMRRQLAGELAMVRRFRAEIKMARKIRHRNICAIHDYGEEGNLLYISMEFIDGIDLRQILREEGGFGAAEGFDVAIQVAKGLEAIHDAGVIHRDLKGHNIMRDARGVIKLLDFGIAKQEDAETGMTGTGQIVGTPEYMSPEQVRGDKVDHRSDLYALGVVIFEIFTGRVPFRGDTPVITIFKHLQEEPPLSGPEAEGIPRTVIPLLKRLLAKNPRDRFASAGEVIDALRLARQTALPECSPAPPEPATLVAAALAPTLANAPTLLPRPLAPTIANVPAVLPRPVAPTRVAPAAPKTRRQAASLARPARLSPRAARLAAALIVFLPLRSSDQTHAVPVRTILVAQTAAGPTVPPAPNPPKPTKDVPTVTFRVKTTPSHGSASPPPPKPVPSTPTTTTVTPAPAPPPPTVPTAEEARAQQVAGLLQQAAEAMSADRHEAAAAHFEEALALDRQNAAATAGLAKARRLLAVARRTFVADRRTTCEAGSRDKGRDDFPDLSSTAFDAQIEFQPNRARPRPGEPYAVRVNVRNEGSKPARILGVSIVTRVNDAAEAAGGAVQIKELAPGQTVMLDEIKGVWREDTNTWALDVSVTTKNKDTCRKSLSWK